MRFLVCGTMTVALFVGPAQAQSHSGECKYEAQRSATVDAAGVRALNLDAGSGSLKIEGKPGSKSVIIRGRACASNQQLLDEIKLESRRDGNTVVVKANVHDRDNQHFFGSVNRYARLDIVIEVPAGMDANIDDGSGEMELSGLGAVDIDDGSGGIVARNVDAVRIDDGSGEIELTGVRGRVDIQDGSGEITLRDIAGAINIDDGSGEIDVRIAKGNVRISDSSGSIRVADVGGDFTVDQDGSGSIDYDNARGRVDVPRRRR